MPDAPLWSVVLPVKGGPRAKSRLAASPDLALALALDCLDAVASCPLVGRVVVVTADAHLLRAVQSLGAAPTIAMTCSVSVVIERRPGAGLVPAVLDGVAALGEDPGPVAVLLADLPALRRQDLAKGLDAVAGALAAGGAMAAVPDAEARGTVLLAAARAAELVPAFGPDSLAAHRRLGATVLELDLPRLRRDVDTPEELESALALGVGPHTRRALAATDGVDGWARCTPTTATTAGF